MPLNRTCHYFYDTIKFWDSDIDFSDILLKKLYNEKYESILIHNIS